MSAPLPLYQVIHQRIAAALPHAIPAASITRLALLVTGILAAKSAVLAQIAAELDALALTRATPAAAPAAPAGDRDGAGHADLRDTTAATTA